MDLRTEERAVRMTPDIPSLLLYGGAGICIFFGAYQLLETYVLVPRMGTQSLYLLHMLRGVIASILLAGFAAWYVVNHPTIVERFDGTTGLKIEHLRWFIQMRWVAAGFALALIVIAVPLTGILSAAHLPQLLICWALLVVANFLFLDALQRGFDFDRQVIVQTVVDLTLLTAMLNASGGIENPLWIAYLFHVIIASILLPKRKAIGIAIFGSAIFIALAVGELLEILPHSTILLFPHSYKMIGGHMHIMHAAHDPVFVTGRSLVFLGVMLLTAHFTTLVTERLRESESDLQASTRKAVLEQRRLEGVIDAAGLGLAVIGHGETIEWINPRLAGWLKWPDGGSAVCPHDHREPRACIACEAERTLASGEQSDIEFSFPARGGELRHVRAVTSPVRDSDGTVAQAVLVVEDVTARKALEAEAMHSGRLAILGQLAAGIAHEIGNPLSSLHTRLQLMKRRDGDSAFAKASIDVLQNQIDRIGRIVRNVSNLSHAARDAWSTVDVNAVAGEALSLVKLDRRAANIRFSERLQESVAPVQGVRDQLLQVALNLMLNALDAMPDGGTLDVATTVRDQHVRLAVRDSGTGIDEETRQRLFEPFFTTKQEGTGLGLSICYSLVHAHRGSIDVASEPGKGSCFTVDLPVATVSKGMNA